MLIGNKNYELELEISSLIVEARIIAMSNEAFMDIRREGSLARFYLRNKLGTFPHNDLFC